MLNVPALISKHEPAAVYRVWIFLYLNQGVWFSSKEISENLGMPIATVHVALKKLRNYPEIVSEREKPWRGRPKRKYKFGKIEYDFKE